MPEAENYRIWGPQLNMFSHPKVVSVYSHVDLESDIMKDFKCANFPSFKLT